jgi:hypothetical protein
MKPSAHLKITSSEGGRFKLSNPFQYYQDTFEFDLKVSSGGFSYIGKFLISSISQNILELKSMNETLSGSTTLKESFMDSFIKLEMLELGHLSIEVFVTDLAKDNSIRVFLDSDQTILKSFIDFFEIVIG